MTDGTPGWFKDPSDPSLARWHDGNDWTDHTLVIADQTPGVEPTPPAVEPTQPAFPAARHGASDDDGGRLKALPWWMKVGAPVVTVLLAVLAFSLVSSGDSDDKTDTVDTVAGDALDDAVDAARLSGLPTSITDSQASDLIERICEAAEKPSEVPALGRALGRLPVLSAGELRSSVDALGDGAEKVCPDELADAPDLIGDLQSAAVAAFTTTTTAPTLVPGGTDAGTDAGTDLGVDGGDIDPNASSTTRRTTSTTRRTTATTRAPGTTVAPTTTLVGVLPGQACSSAGASARNRITGATLTCQKSCFSPSTKLTWSTPCTTTTTRAPSPPASTTTTAAPPPTLPPGTIPD